MQYSDQWDLHMRAETSIWLLSRIVIMSDIAMPHPLPLPSLPVCSVQPDSRSEYQLIYRWGNVEQNSARGHWDEKPCTNTLTGTHIWAITHILTHIHYRSNVWTHLTDFMFLMMFKMLWCNGLYLITSCEWRLKMCRTGSVTYKETQPTT